MLKQQVVTVTLNPSIDKTLVLPSLEIGGLNRVGEIRLDPGGKGINVAKILQTFRVPVTAAGLIAGQLGGQIRKSLEASGIQTGFVEVKGETRTNLKLVDTSSRLTTEINEPGFEVAPADLEALRDQLKELLKETGVLVLGGSLPKGVSEDVYAGLVQAAGAAGVKTILDADGAAFAEGLKAAPYAVKPNLYELEQLTGRKLDTDEAIVKAGRQLLERGVSLVVISMGGDGAIVMNSEAAYRVRPFAIQPLSTVGAGDSMVAVMAYCLLENRPLEELARWSVAAGTVTASKAGTQVCTYEEIISHAGQVSIAPLSM